MTAGEMGLRASTAALLHVARKAGLRIRKNLALVSGLAAAVGIEWQVHEEGLVGALRTGLAWANMAVDADSAEYPLVLNIISRRVAELLCVFQLTPE